MQTIFFAELLQNLVHGLADVSITSFVLAKRKFK